MENKTKSIACLYTYKNTLKITIQTLRVLKHKHTSNNLIYIEMYPKQMYLVYDKNQCYHVCIVFCV